MSVKVLYVVPRRGKTCLPMKNKKTRFLSERLFRLLNICSPFVASIGAPTEDSANVSN